MRVTTDIWVSALVRRVFSAGGFAAVMKRGAAEAGAVHILTRDRFGEVLLFSPAPQSSYETGKPDGRYFTRVSDLTSEQIDAKLEREKRFDTDIWIIEVEAAGEIGDLIEIRAD